MLQNSSDFPHVVKLVNEQLAVAPEQEKLFRRRFEAADDGELAALDEFAVHILRLAGDCLEQHLEDYRWLCQQQIAEELHFRRQGRYRLDTFEEAFQQVYSNKEYMTRYMNGLLMTQLWWANHTQVMRYYRDVFLRSNKPDYSHLEIGPGHGLFLYFAAADRNVGDVQGWDISQASIALTTEALRKLGVVRMPRLRMVDMFANPEGSFDSVVFSEVLEHMENPAEALAVLRSVLAPDGRLFINMPINSPAPDHLFNAESPEALRAFIERSGLRVIGEVFFPATNQTLDQARKKKLTISCVFVCQKRE
jgi:2-polyprenyl-3-methyl-5-hydroxy-6-metoxy-1,4-benzoquinol methylase